MLAAGKWIVTIVPAGIALGALLGAAADPAMKDAPAPWWRLAGANAIVISGEPGTIPAGPDDLSPFGGYRPDLDYDAEVWGSPIPAAELAALAEQPLPDELPRVTYGVTAAEATADQAEAAAQEAIAAEAPEPAPAPEAGPEPAEAREPELASAGLY